MKTVTKVVINLLLPLSFFSMSTAYAGCTCEIADICKDERNNVHRPCNQSTAQLDSTEECRSRVTYGNQALYRCNRGQWETIGNTKIPADFNPESI